MQSSSDTGEDRTADPFTELVHAVRSSLMQLPSPAVNCSSPSNTATTLVTSSVAPASPMAKPATYSGAAEDCSGFLLQCSLYLESNAHLFTTERSRVAFIINLLTGKALQWAQSLWESNSSATGSVTDFCSQLKSVFGQQASELSVHDQLFTIRQQRNESVSDYAVRFRTLAYISGWNETALITAYRHGLCGKIQSLIVVYEDSLGLESLIQKSIRVAQRLTACRQLTPAVCPPPALPSVAPPAPEPMQIDSHHLSTSERQRRINTGLCLYCGGRGTPITIMSRPTSTPSGEYHPSTTSNCSIDSNLGYSKTSPLFYFSTSPHRLRLSGELHQPANIKSSKCQASSKPRRTQNHDHTRKAAGPGSYPLFLPHSHPPRGFPA
uniref:Retrotransposon gag domain-containing protein n=1 Tax=Cyprinus carpio carpio TaxID=630221 RepID=A0A8C0Y9S6_CYPCA